MNVTANSPQDNDTAEFNGFQIKVDSDGRVHTVYRAKHLVANDGHENIYYARQDPGRDDWHTVLLANTASLLDCEPGNGETADIGGPALAISSTGRYIHLTWNCGFADERGNPIPSKPRHIHYHRSLDWGQTFTTVPPIEGGDFFGGATICYGKRPPPPPNTNDLALSPDTGDIVNVIYTAGPNNDLHVRYSKNNGSTFDTEVIPDEGSHKEAPVCAIGDNVVHLVWQDDRDGDRNCFDAHGTINCRDIFYRRSLTEGATWEGPTNLSHTQSAGSADASLAIGVNGKIHVTYHDDSEDPAERSWEIYYIKSDNFGASWPRFAQKLTNTNPAPMGLINIDFPSVAATPDGMVHIVWQDRRNPPPPFASQIFYKEGDGESRWTREVPISCEDESDGCEVDGRSLAPSIAHGVDGSLHTLWSGGDQMSEKDIYYRRREP